MQNKEIFNINIPGEQPSKGCLLVAEPFLREKWFNHAVIYMLDYEGVGESSMGIVLNHPTDTTLWEIFSEKAPADSEVADLKVYCGGPVGTDRLYFLHTLGDTIIPGAQKLGAFKADNETVALGNSLWIGGDFEAAKDYVRMGYPVDGHIRFFIGYSGWSPRQLNDEVDMKTWAVIPEGRSPQQLLKGDGDAVWHESVRHLGPAYRSWLLHPQEPWAN